jgi:acyl-CoA thioesterase
VSADPREPFAELLGFEVIERKIGGCSIRTTVGPDHLNAHGLAHGGFIFSLADTAFGIAANSHGPVAVAIATSIHFVRPARPRDVLVAEAKEISLGRSTATYEVTVSVRDQSIALFTGTVHRRGA